MGCGERLIDRGVKECINGKLDRVVGAAVVVALGRCWCVLLFNWCGIEKFNVHRIRGLPDQSTSRPTWPLEVSQKYAIVIRIRIKKKAVVKEKEGQLEYLSVRV